MPPRSPTAAAPPTDAALRRRLGSAWAAFDGLRAWLREAAPGAAFEWRLSKTSGWYLVCNRKKQRLFYFFPRDGDFTLKLVLNDRALAQAKGAGVPEAIAAQLRTAKKYPEGTLLVFDAAGFDGAGVRALLAIKLAR